MLSTGLECFWGEIFEIFPPFSRYSVMNARTGTITSCHSTDTFLVIATKLSEIKTSLANSNSSKIAFAKGISAASSLDFTSTKPSSSSFPETNFITIGFGVISAKTGLASLDFCL